MYARPSRTASRPDSLSPLSSKPKRGLTPHEPRQSLCAATTGDHAEVDVLVGDPGVVAHQHDVGGLHEFETARHGDAVDGHNDGDFDARDRIARTAERGEQLPQRLGAGRATALYLVDIASGAEVSASAADEDDIDVLSDAQDRPLELTGKVGRDGVQLIWPVQGDPADAVGDSTQHVRHM